MCKEGTSCNTGHKRYGPHQNTEEKHYAHYRTTPTSVLVKCELFVPYNNNQVA